MTLEALLNWFAAHKGSLLFCDDEAGKPAVQLRLHRDGKEYAKMYMLTEGPAARTVEGALQQAVLQHDPVLLDNSPKSLAKRLGSKE